MTINQLIFFGSATCVGLAFALILFAMWRGHVKSKRKLADEQARRAALEKRFSVIVDADAEAVRITRAAISEAQETTDKARIAAEARETQSHALVARLSTDAAALDASLSDLRRSYAEKKAIFDRLAGEVAIFDERLAFAEMGVYEPHFDFDTSEDFKDAINRVRDRQKAMVSDKTAVVCPMQWTVDGSVSKGKTMTDRNIRLTLRAFNSECDAAISNTCWNNANAMEKRIENARNQIDKHNASNRVEITDPYFRLKLEELRLTHEYREKVKQEREERAEDAKAAREEQKLIREMERAEEEEARYQCMLEKARAEAASVAGPKLEAYTQQIAILERDWRRLMPRSSVPGRWQR